ncbi:MAG: dihydrolipoyl dehydrogenase [Candidatus Eisenbacteria bacterium]|nr:dihydrolipoyl dehydrogenase [Candidatus Eisenbacteria bacterium]
MAEKHDLTVIGGGPGGYVAALRAAQLGLDVALVEKAELGGVCLNWGCIPTKALLTSAAAAELARGADELGVAVGSVAIDAGAVFARKDRIVERLRGGVETLLGKRGIAVRAGEARIVEPGVVLVSAPDGSVTLESRNVIVATGSAPIVPDTMPRDGRVVLTSRDALSRPDLPDSVVVIGAGAVGCEFAAFYSGMGVEVTLVEMMPELLPGEDVSAARLLRQSFRKRGVDVRLKSAVEKIEVSDGRATTILSTDDALDSETVLLALGRRAAVEEAGLRELGADVDGGAVVVDDRMLTSVERTYAIGDVVGGWMLAHVASREGIVAAHQAAGRDVRIDYRAVPRCAFTTPEIASVGMSEADARSDGLEVMTGRFPFSASGKAVASGEGNGFVKVVARASDGEVLGGVIVGPHASDLIHEVALAVEARLSWERVAEMIHTHPTLSEAVCEAFEAVGGLSIHSG